MANLCRRARETSQSCDTADPQSGLDGRRGRQDQLVLRLKENLKNKRNLKLNEIVTKLLLGM